MENDLSEAIKFITEYNSDDLINFVLPEVLEKELETRFKLAPNQNILETVEFVTQNSINTSSPHFVNQLYGGPNPVGLVASYLIEKLNTNQHTYEVAPVFVITEKIVLKELRKYFYGSENGDGISCPGGSIANMYALVSARHKKFPSSKLKGIYNSPPLVVYISEDAHYSASKVSNWMGLGLENVIKIKTDKNGKMIPIELQKAITETQKAGKISLCVIATAGTTVLGAFDDLEEISLICENEKIWLHCDAAWGGAFIFSPKLKSVHLKSIEKCDSICWNGHKMLGVPLQSSFFISRHDGLLAETNSVSAPYLFQPNKHYNQIYDASGEKSVQCGRKADSFKLWLMWTTLGTKNFQDSIEQTEDCARYFYEKINDLEEEFICYLDSHQCTNVFFWYIPKSFRNKEKNSSWWNEIGNIQVKIRSNLILENKLMIGFSPLTNKNIPNALRLVLTAYPHKNYELMDSIIEMIREAADKC